MPVFNNVSKWISKDKEGREDISDQISEVASQETRENLENVRQTVSQTISKAISSHSWMVKASRNATGSDPYAFIRSGISFGGVVGATASFATGICGWKDVPLIVCMLAIMFVALNPMDIISRWIARQSRFLICADIVAYMFAIDAKSWAGAGAATFWTACTATLIWFMNRRWLSAYNWFYTKAVIHALVKAPDNAGVDAWNDHGKRETRTLLAECGLPSDDDTLQIFAKGIYIVGFYSAWFSTADDIKAREEAEEALKEKETELAVQESLYKQLESDLENADKIAEENGKRYAAESSKRRELEERVEALEAMIEKAKEPQADIRDEIRELRKIIDPDTSKPISYKKVTEILRKKGFTESQATIGRIGKALEDEQKAS